jgi:hypothetical protein
MGFIIGANPYGGLFTKAQFKQGKGANPGTRAQVVGANGQTNEFVAIKLAAATWLNGVAVIIDGAAAPGSAVTTASGLPAAAQHARLGILCFASATATQTMAGTAYGWAQIYGEALAFVSASVSTPGLQLAIGASGQLIAAVAQVSASAQAVGIALATATAAAGGLTKVFLTYPQFSGLPDANLS